MKQKLRMVRIIVLVGILTFAAPALLSPVLAADPTPCPAGMECVAGIAFPATGLPDTRIEDILLSFMSWLFGIFGFLAIIVFLIAGIQYFMAAGNPDSAKKAKSTMINAIIGILVALSGFIIILAISNFLSGYSSF